MNILIVDDEASALENLVSAIRTAASDAELFAFTKPSDAHTCSQQTHIDTAFLDINMGGINGVDLARKLKEANPKVNIIFVTAYDDYTLDAFAMHASDYILKPARANDIADALKNLRYHIPEKKPGLSQLAFKTFGNFEVYYQGKPLHFARNKSKELLAYLIHKRGTGCSGKELAAVLFEDKPYTLSIQRQVQTAIHTMLATLKEIGCEDIIVRTYNNIAINVGKIDCDYYRYLEGDEEAVRQFSGEYMASYSWAESTLAFLLAKADF